MMSAPFLLAIAGLLFSYYLLEEAEVRRRRGLLFVAIPLAAAFLTIVELWALLTAVGLLLLTVTFASARPSTLLPAVGSRLRRTEDRTSPLLAEGQRYSATVLAVGVVVFLTLVAALPFLASMTGGSQNHVRLVESGQRTAFGPLLVIHGVFLVATVAELVRVHDVVGPVALRRSIVVIVVASVLLAALVSLVPAAVVLLPFVLVPWYLLRTGRVRCFSHVLVVAGVGLVLVTDVIFIEVVEDVLTGRVNTVFKFYMHSWLLWGVATGVITTKLLAAARPLRTHTSPRNLVPALLVVVLVLSSSAFVAVSTHEHVERATTSETIDDAVPIPSSLSPSRRRSFECSSERR